VIIVDQLVIESAKQAPALILLVVVVWMLLRHLAERDKAFRILSDSCHETAQAMLEKTERHSDRVIDALQGNATVIGKVCKLLDTMPSDRRKTNGPTL
jgi:hypothetical protein